MIEYVKTNKKCLESKTVYKKYMFGEFAGYYYKNKDKLEKKLHRQIKMFGFQEYKKATLFNGWYYKENENKYYLFDNGSITDKADIIDGLPMSYI